MQTDGRMDAQTVMMKLTVTSYNLVNVPKKTFTTADKQYLFLFSTILTHENVYPD
jgi:hypothetical protein